MKNHIENFLSVSGGFHSSEKKRYSLWVYDGGDIIDVYPEEKPNTVEIWFEFNEFSRFYWEYMESECLESDRLGVLYYNFCKMKDFMIRNMMTGTNIPGIDFSRRNHDGSISDTEYEKIMRIHPRILRSLFDKINFFGNEISKSEERKLERQCAILFGEGGSVSDPHPWISAYCNLVSFWDKFGLNYFDIMRLPNDVFNNLKKIIYLDNSYKSKSISSKK